MGLTHEAIPDNVSVPVTFSVTGWRYHPFALGARASVPDASGAVASYLNVTPAAALVFPALSVHVPDRVTEPASGPP